MYKYTAGQSLLILYSWLCTMFGKFQIVMYTSYILCHETQYNVNCMYDIIIVIVVVVVLYGVILYVCLSLDQSDCRFRCLRGD